MEMGGGLPTVRPSLAEVYEVVLVEGRDTVWKGVGSDQGEWENRGQA